MKNIILYVAGILAPIIMVALLVGVMFIYEYLAEYPVLFIICYGLLAYKLISIQQKGNGL